MILLVFHILFNLSYIFSFLIDAPVGPAAAIPWWGVVVIVGVVIVVGVGVAITTLFLGCKYYRHRRWVCGCPLRNIAAINVYVCMQLCFSTVYMCVPLMYADVIPPCRHDVIPPCRRDVLYCSCTYVDGEASNSEDELKCVCSFHDLTPHCEIFTHETVGLCVHCNLRVPFLKALLRSLCRRHTYLCAKLTL